MVQVVEQHSRGVQETLKDRSLPPHTYSDPLVSKMQTFPQGPLQIPNSENHVFTLPDRECLNSTQIAAIVSYVIANEIQNVTIVDTMISPPIVALCRSLCRASPLTAISIIDHHRSESVRHESDSLRQLERLADTPQGRLLSCDLHSRSSVPACALLVDRSRANNKGSLTIAIPLDGDAAHSIALLGGCVDRKFDSARLSLINTALRNNYPDLIREDLWHPFQLVALLEDAPDMRKLFKPHTPLGDAKDKLLSIYPQDARFSSVMHEMLILFPSLSSTIFCTWIQTLTDQGTKQSFDEVCMNPESPLKSFYKKAKHFLDMRTRLQERPAFDAEGVPIVDLSSLSDLFSRGDTITKNADKTLERFAYNVARQAWRSLRKAEGPEHPTTHERAPYTLIKTPTYIEHVGLRTNWYIVALHGDPRDAEEKRHSLLATYGNEGSTMRQVFSAPFAGALAVREEYLGLAREALDEQFGSAII